MIYINPMSPMSKEEYLRLLQDYVDRQYDDAIDDYNIEEMEWIPAEPEIEKKTVKANTNGTIDLTDVKSDKIREELFKCTNLRVGKFKIRINRYQGLPTPDGSQVAMNLEVWEERSQTPNGHPCKIDFPVVFHKDKRFIGKPWVAKYFNNRGICHNVPTDVVVEVVRWMQALKKLTAFL